MIEMVHEKTGKSHLTEEDSLMVTHHEKMLGTTRASENAGPSHKERPRRPRQSGLMKIREHQMLTAVGRGEPTLTQASGGDGEQRATPEARRSVLKDREATGRPRGKYDEIPTSHHTHDRGPDGPKTQRSTRTGAGSRRGNPRNAGTGEVFLTGLKTQMR